MIDGAMLVLQNRFCIQIYMDNTVQDVTIIKRAFLFEYFFVSYSFVNSMEIAQNSLFMFFFIHVDKILFIKTGFTQF
ncbi:hypothetical protein B9C88_17220 [Brevibacillus laterosporus]|nr:hypothetical protein B9C88_17220 [Brevibacillus laterosporus]